MGLHDPSWNPTCMQSFKFELVKVFEIEGSELKNKKKNWENELFVISLVSDEICYTCMLSISTILQWQKWIHIESESLNRIFQM